MKGGLLLLCLLIKVSFQSDTHHDLIDVRGGAALKILQPISLLQGAGDSEGYIKVTLANFGNIQYG